MIERDMEDLIAEYPEDFFPRKHFVLIGRQESFAGIGRFDLLFEDEFKSTILMELKARTLKYEDATQVAKYRDELKRSGSRNIVMWLVGPQIPSSVREFLDDKGIMYTEIHVSEFRQVAERRGFLIKSEVAPQKQPLSTAFTGQFKKLSGGRVPKPIAPPSVNVPTGPVVTSRSQLHWRTVRNDLVLENPEGLDLVRFLGLTESFTAAVPSGKNKSLINDLKSWSENPRHARLTSSTVESLLRWTITSTTWKAAVPFAHEIWLYLFGSPVPTWKVWNRSTRKYETDSHGRQRWIDSVSKADD